MSLGILHLWWLLQPFQQCTIRCGKSGVLSVWLLHLWGLLLGKQLSAPCGAKNRFLPLGILHIRGLLSPKCEWALNRQLELQ